MGVGFKIEEDGIMRSKCSNHKQLDKVELIPTTMRHYIETNRGYLDGVTLNKNKFINI